MNYIDTPLLGSETPPQASENQPTLNEEVSQVLGQLNRFWGGVRKQSLTVFDTARKDLGDVVVQAQKELSKLTTGESNEPSEAAAKGVKKDEASDSSLSSTPIAEQPTPPQSSQNLFSRLQSVIPPNIIASVQDKLPESLKHAPEVDLAQLRTTLTSEFHRMQGLTRAQAEEYVHKSEVLLRDVMKEAGEVFKDAVKVIPPDTMTSANGSTLIWDGTDMWMLASEPSDGETVKGKGKAAVLATRADALLKRLSNESGILIHDPTADGDTRAAYEEWLQSNVDGEEGGITGEKWSLEIRKSLEADYGASLAATRDELVPSQLTEDDFWRRYFFRVHQITSEQEKRRVLIQGSISTDEDFSWDDDDDDDASKLDTATLNDKLSDSSATIPSQDSPTKSNFVTKNEDSREGSEASYDIVSSNGEGKAKAKPDDDGDSDWE